MDDIRESRIIKIKNKVFNLKSIRDLANIVWDEYQSDIQSLEENKGKWILQISFFIDCFDDSKFESKNINFFDENSIINSKRIRSIGIEYINMKDNFNISIRITHGDSDYFNYITVKGNDSIWVNGMITKLLSMIESAPPQNLAVYKYRSLISMLLALGFGTIFFYILKLIMNNFLKSADSASVPVLNELILLFPFIKYLIKYVFAFILGNIFAGNFIYKIENSVCSLWPLIEIQIGPEHTLIEKKRRDILLKISSTVLLPFMLSIIYDIFKG